MPAHHLPSARQIHLKPFKFGAELMLTTPKESCLFSTSAGPWWLPLVSRGIPIRLFKALLLEPNLVYWHSGFLMRDVLLLPFQSFASFAVIDWLIGRLGSCWYKSHPEIVIILFLFWWLHSWLSRLWHYSKIHSFPIPISSFPPPPFLLSLLF